MKKAVHGAALLALVLLGAAPAFGDAAVPLSAGAYIKEVGDLRVGDQVPRFKAKDIYGTDVCLEELTKSGKKVILTFWSMYCLACVDKFNAMVAVQKKFEPQGLRVIAVNTDGEYRNGEQSIRDFLAAYEKKHEVKINFPVLYDESNWVAHAMRIAFLPTIISVDPQGRVHGFYQGFNEAGEAEIQAGIETLVQQMLAVYPPGGGESVPPAGPWCPEKK